MSRSLFSEATYNGIGFGLGFAVTMDPAQTLIPGSPGEYQLGRRGDDLVLDRSGGRADHDLHDPGAAVERLSAAARAAHHGLCRDHRQQSLKRKPGSAAHARGTGVADERILHRANILGGIRPLLLCSRASWAPIRELALPKPSLPVRLALLVAGTTLPLIVFAAGIVFNNYEQDRRDATQRVLRNRAQHPPRARRRDAAHDRRAAGAGADQRAAQRRFRRLPPHRAGLPRPIWRRRRRAGGRPRRPPAVLLGHAGHREPAAAQQPRHRRKGVCDQAAGNIPTCSSARSRSG